MAIQIEGVPDFTYPWTTSVGATLIVFGSAWFLFHLLLVRIGNLTKAGWKRVDYYWLALASAALLTEPAKVREMVSAGYLEYALQSREFEHSRVRGIVDHARSFACYKFARTKDSPPNLAEIQQNADAVCAWMKTVASYLPEEPGAKIRVDLIPPAPKEEYYRVSITQIESAASKYNASVDQYDETVGPGGWPYLGTVARLLSPFLLAIALALRLTKVSGEIRLENVADVKFEPLPMD